MFLVTLLIAVSSYEVSYIDIVFLCLHRIETTQLILRSSGRELCESEVLSLVDSFEMVGHSALIMGVECKFTLIHIVVMKCMSLFAT